MRWLFATLALLAATGALIAWIYVRDRNPNGWHPPERQLALHDADTVLAASQEWPCGHTCFVTQLRRDGSPHRWFVRITFPWGPRCVKFDSRHFAFVGGRLVGVRFVACGPSRRTAPAGAT